MVCLKCEILIIDTDCIKCLLFKRFKKINESCSFSKGARLSSTYLRQNLGLLRLYTFNQLDL